MSSLSQSVANHFLIKYLPKYKENFISIITFRLIPSVHDLDKMFFIYIPTVLIVLCYILYYHFTKHFDYWKKRNVPGPKPIPIFGNFKEVTFRRKFVGNEFQSLYESYPKEKVVGIYWMRTPCLVIRDLDIIRHIMLRDFELFKDRGVNFGRKGLSRNLFHADTETWSVLRSRFNPMFTPGKLKNMFHLLNERGNTFINNLEKQCWTNPEYEVHELVQKFTIAAIFACAFGADLDPFNSEINETLRTLDKLILRPTYGVEIDMTYPGILNKLNITPFPAKITSFFENLVADVVSQRNGKPSSRGDFMDLILSLRNLGEVDSAYSSKEGTDNKSIAITDDIVAAQAFIFYVAGYETSATTMAFLLHSLALHPEIQDKLREEIDKVTKAYNSEITYESLNEMKYLEQTFNETLRMYPIVDPLKRRAMVEYKLPGTDLVIEKGTYINIPVAGIHYDENYYPNPHVFDPDRFTPEQVRIRHPCAFLPFGVGPRNCIGMRFGSIQSRLCIAKILSKFKIERSSNTEVPIDIHPNKIILGPKNGIYLNIVPRKS